MTSYGIEWDTNLLLCEPEDNYLEGRGTIVSFAKDLIKLKSEEWVSDKFTRPDEAWGPHSGDDCMFSVEGIIGPVYSKDPREFNVPEFYELYEMFRRRWSVILNDTYIQDARGRKLHVLTISKLTDDLDRELGTRKSNDCCLENPETDITTSEGEESLRWAYHQSFRFVKGTPQMSVGFSLHRMLPLFQSIYQLYEKYKHSRVADCNGVYKSLEGLKGAKQVEMIAHAYENMQKLRYSIKGRSENFRAILMLVIYEAIAYESYGGMREGRSSYRKSWYLFKPRTNIRNMAEMLIPEELESLKDALISLHADGHADYSEYLHKWFNPEIGYHIVKVNLPDKVDVLLQGIYNVPPQDLEEIQKYVDLRQVPYVTPYGIPAPSLMIDERSCLVVTEWANLDIGEWYYGAGDPPGVELEQPNFIFECRSPLTLRQLACISSGRWDPRWSQAAAPKNKIVPGTIKIEDLPELVQDNIDFYKSFAPVGT